MRSNRASYTDRSRHCHNGSRFNRATGPWAEAGIHCRHAYPCRPHYRCVRTEKKVGSRIAAPAAEHLPCADANLEEGEPFQVGSIVLNPLHTPGHTAGHFSYVFNDRVFTGDALLIEGCGRTDFQQGSADALYRSVKEKLFCLPDDTIIYPAHDYKGRYVSTIAQEKKRNPRLGQGKTLEEFRQIMASLNLPYPKFIDYAVPGNKQCGVCPVDLPENLEKYCQQMTESFQG